jgi:hypothetical protein
LLLCRPAGVLPHLLLVHLCCSCWQPLLLLALVLLTAVHQSMHTASAVVDACVQRTLVTTCAFGAGSSTARLSWQQRGGGSRVY